MKLSYKLKLFVPLILLALLGTPTFGQSSRARQNPNSTVNKSDTPLHILLKPDPIMTDELKMLVAESEVTVNLRVEFLDVGLIGAINPISSPPGALTDAAIEAAARIKFEPQKKNGRAVTIQQIISYVFSPAISETKKVVPENLQKARAIVTKAIEMLGGQKYLAVKTLVGRGKFSLIRDGVNVSFQSFTDVIVYPSNEITEFKEHGVKSVQANYGDGGWVFDGSTESLTVQSADQIGNFRRSMRVNLDNFLRGVWDNEAQLSFVGRRQAGLGKRNNVIRLTFEDGFWVEFEFSDAGFPEKSVTTSKNREGRETTEEDRFAQFIDVSGIRTPYIIDHYTNDIHISRVNYESVEYNKPISDAIFAKPDNIKALKKDIKP